MAGDTTKLPAPVTIATIVATSAKTDKQLVESLGRLPEFGVHPAQLRNDREPLPGSPRQAVAPSHGRGRARRADKHHR